MHISEERRDETFLGAFDNEPANEICAGLEPDWGSFYCLTSGRRGQNIADFYDHLLTTPAGAGASGIDVCVWSISQPAYVQGWMERFGGNVRVLLDSFNMARRPRAGRKTPFDEIVEILGGWGSNRLRCGAVHLKLVVAGGVPLTLWASGNVEKSNYRCEFVHGCRHPAVHGMVSTWVDWIWKTTSPSPDARRLADRDVSRAHVSFVGLPASTSVGRLLPPASVAASAVPAPAAAAAPAVRLQTVPQLARRVQRGVQDKLGGVYDPGELSSMALALSRSERITRGDVARRERVERERAELLLERDRKGWLSREGVISAWNYQMGVFGALFDGLTDVVEADIGLTIHTVDDVQKRYRREIVELLARMARTPAPGLNDDDESGGACLRK